MSEHIRPEHSLALMALAEDDPERVLAEQHAEACPQCRALLSEGDVMLGWIDQSMGSAPVDAALKAKIRQVVHAPVRESQNVLAKLLLGLGMLASLLFAWFDGQPGELAPALGLKCMLFENAVAVAPFAVAAFLGMRGVFKPVPINMAVVSMAGALAGQLLLHFRCESGATSHLFAFHVLGVALAAGLGHAATTRLWPARAA